MNSSEVKARRNGLYLERRTLRQEEKALRAVLKRAREQQTQLQVEALELQARLRGQGRGQQREGWGPAQQPQGEARARVRRNSVSEQMRATQGRMVSSAATSVSSSSSVQGGTTGAALVGSQVKVQVIKHWDFIIPPLAPLRTLSVPHPLRAT